METRDLFHSINMKRKLHFNQLLDTYNLNFIEMEILAFLHREPDSNTFTQIMKSKDYAKSHISSAINHLVDCGYLAKTGASTNKKVYHLHLLEKSTPVIQDYHRYDQTFQEKSLAGVSAQDLETFQTVIARINQNLLDD